MGSPLRPQTYLFDDEPVRVDRSASLTLLSMTEEERAEAAERERTRGTFGFGRVLDEMPAGIPSAGEGSE